MKIFVSGAAGFVGRKVCEYLGRTNDVIAFTRSDLDITNAARVKTLVEAERPDLMINCAVLGVDECEADPTKAVAVNVTGAGNLATAAACANASIVHLSTNYVFDGERTEGLYTTEDEARPINTYGRTKLEGERAVLAACERSYIVRTSWVFGGSTKGFFDRAIAAIKCDKPIEAATDNWASVTLIDDLAERIGKIVKARHYGIHHAANSGVCSKYEFAVETARLLGRDPGRIVIPVRADATLVTKRPRYTPMECKFSEKLGLPKPRDWRTALAEYVEKVEV